ncbi:MAG: DUF3769 domain-containing protein [Synechococcus sp.]
MIPSHQHKRESILTGNVDREGTAQRRRFDQECAQSTDHVEERLPIPVSRTQRITQEEEEVENRWVFGIDNDDQRRLLCRSRTLRPIELERNQHTLMSLQPQLLLQRAVDGTTKQLRQA